MENGYPVKSGEIINIDYNEKNSLYLAYMPFVKNGGLFIPTRKAYSIGDQVNIVVGLPDEAVKISVSGKIIWITPIAAQGNRVPGIGVQFRDDGTAHTHIEAILGRILKQDEAAHTM